jgi:hypothetical protein
MAEIRAAYFGVKETGASKLPPFIKAFYLYRQNMQDMDKWIAPGRFPKSKRDLKRGDALKPGLKETGFEIPSRFLMVDLINQIIA